MITETLEHKVIKLLRQLFTKLDTNIANIVKNIGI